ncbi:hypothetical protein [Leptothrix discophora]|uniref:Uncharacterized protein n=1 Tax=Leptothrix discophora TaxID=89 RepID=A0ABT9G2W9_LEPDI|nr:hypothetical protein [Leptothrix discophora]MDP4300839.1 hypothetical protein [Leptothrix discophora]
MSSRPASALAALALCAVLQPVAAQNAALRSDAADAPAARPEPRVERVVIDEGGNATRIEEEHVRGEVRSIHVQPRGLVRKGYEIMSASGGRDPSDTLTRGVVGQRMWSVMSF